MKGEIFMKEVDDLELKAEIDQIAKKIDTILQNVEKLDPDRTDKSDEIQN